MCYKVTFVFLILIPFSISSQTKILEQFDSIIKLSTLSKQQKVVKTETLIEESKADELSISQVYHDLAKFIYKKNLSLDNAIYFTEKASEIRKNYIKESPSLFKGSFNNLAKFQYEKGLYSKAIKTCDSLLSYCNATEVRVAKVNWLKARIYEAIGDFKKALDCYEKSESIYKALGKHQKLLSIYKNVLAIYAGFDDVKYKEAFFLNYRKVQTLSNYFDISEKDLIGLKLNCGNFYDTLKDYNNSKEAYKEALALAYKLNDSVYAAKSLNNLGVVYKKTNNINKSIESLRAALSYASNLPSQKAESYDNLGDIKLLQNNYVAALKNYQKAIYLTTYNASVDYTTLPKFQDMEMSNLKIDILGYLRDKAGAWIAYYNKTKNKALLKKALETLELADKVVNLIYFESREDLSKLFWREKGNDLYQKAVDVSYLLNEPEKAYCFIEKSKALLLLENVTNLNARVLAKLPHATIEREVKLLEEINNYKAELVTNNLLKRKRIKDSFITKKNEYSKFLDSLETTFPKYHNYKKGIQIYDAKITQKHLKENQLVLQYKIDKNKAYVSLASNTEIKTYKIEEAELLEKRILAFHDALKKPFLNKKDQEDYKSLAYTLYNQLLPFMKGKLKAFQGKQFLVIQDGILQNIPLEPLIVDNRESPINELYLINFCKISYAYSFSSLMVTSKLKRTYNADYLAMSPTIFKDKSLSSLIIYREELQKLESTLETKFLTRSNTTKQKFIEAYGGYKVVHLSTHGGVTEDKKPWLAFYDDKLELGEMYFNNQYTDLVVLSACKTSKGELRKGEGVMSIARGFVNSGAKSVLASLWDIDQKSNNEIIYSFYNYLNQGYTKTEALNRAKLDYIYKNKNTSEVSPYYWSAITLTGNNEAIFKKGNNLYYFLLLLVPIFYVYKRRKQIKKSA